MYENEIKSLDANQWELFAQDVLYHLGFSIDTGPSIGADDGLDMISAMGGKRYLVSCKHNIISGKSVGVANEVDISDRVLRHKCQGFLAFYSTGPTSGLKRKFVDLRERGIEVIEIYRNDVFDIMPTMMGFTLQKYFPRPQEISHHLNEPTKYKALICIKEGCGKDILAKENINRSMASLINHEGGLQLLYGCKSCINMDDDCGWIEMTQIRYIEQLLGWRSMIDGYLSSGLNPAPDFYKNWSALQEATIQLLVPPGWGRWLA